MEWRFSGSSDSPVAQESDRRVLLEEVFDGIAILRFFHPPFEYYNRKVGRGPENRDCTQYLLQKALSDRVPERPENFLATEKLRFRLGLPRQKHSGPRIAISHGSFPREKSGPISSYRRSAFFNPGG